MKHLSKAQQHLKSGSRATQIHRRRRLFIVAVMVLTVLIGSVQVIRAQHALGETNAALVSANKKLKTVKANKSVLKVQVDQLQNETYLEKLVRQKYYVAKPGEILFNLPDKTNQPD